MRSQGGTFAYSYDVASNLTGVTYPDGKAAAYGYDGLNRMTSAALKSNPTAPSKLWSACADMAPMLHADIAEGSGGLEDVVRFLLRAALLIALVVVAAGIALGGRATSWEATVRAFDACFGRSVICRSGSEAPMAYGAAYTVADVERLNAGFGRRRTRAESLAGRPARGRRART